MTDAWQALVLADDERICLPVPSGAQEQRRFPSSLRTVDDSKSPFFFDSRVFFILWREKSID